MSLWAPTARALILGALGVPFDAAGFGADQAIETLKWVARRFGALPPDLDKRMSEAIEAAVLGKGWRDDEALAANTLAALAQAGDLGTLIVQAAYRSDRAARAVVDAARTRARGIDAPDWDRIATALEAAFGSLLGFRDVLAATEREFREQVLGNAASLQRLLELLPECLAAAAPRIAARSLLRRPDASGATTVRHSLAARLVAENAVVPFHGRETELGDLVTWCTEEALIGIHLLYGRGGTGKTRLAIELLQDMAWHHGWQTGFLQPEADGADRAVLRALIDQPYPTLIAVDYAEGRVPCVAALIELLARRSAPGPIRLLLLARSNSEWKSQLEAKAGNGRSLLFGAYREAPLHGLAPTRDARRTDFEGAAHAFVVHFAKTEPGRAIIHAPSPPADIDDEGYANALVLQAAALLRALSPDEVAARNVVAELFAHEHKLWREALPGHDVPGDRIQDVSRLVAAITLLGGCNADLLPALLDSCGVARDHQFGITALVRSFYLTDRKRIDALRPDLLGEHLVGREVTDPAFAFAVLDAACAKEPARAQNITRTWLTALGRAAKLTPAVEPILTECLVARIETLVIEAVAVAQQIGDPVGKALAEAVRRAPQRAPLQALQRAIPEETVTLMEVGPLCVQSLLDRLPKASTQSKIRLQRAALLQDLASRVARTGDLKRGLRLAQEANQIVLQIWPRPDAVTGPGRPEALYHHAITQHTLSIRLAEDRHLAEAARASERAIAWWEELIAIDRPRHLRGYGTFLSNHAQRLAENERWLAAIDMADRALRVRWEIHRNGGDPLKKDVAYTLRNRGMALLELQDRPKRVQEAISDLEAALAIWREIRSKQPDEAQESFANDSRLLAAAHLTNDDPSAAALPANESVDEFRALARERPAAFASWLADALRVRAIVRKHLDDTQGASKDLAEAAEWLAQIPDHPLHVRLRDDIAAERASLNCPPQADPA